MATARPDAVATPPARGVLGYDRSLEEEIFALQLEIYPSRQRDLVPLRWRWMFLASAARLGVAPMAWVYRGRQRVVAHQGAIPVKVKIGSTEVVTGWFVETMAAEEVRGKAVGPMLIKKALEDLPFNLSLGQTPQMRALQFAMGWREVAALPTYMFLLRPDRLLERRIPNRVLRAPAACALSVIQRARHRLGRNGHGIAPEVVQVDRFGRAHDALWARVSRDYTCAVVRDASYLNWKYVGQPGQDYVRLEIHARGTLAAVAVLLIREPDAVYGYRRGVVVDLVMPAGDTGVAWSTFEAVRLFCARKDVDVILCDLIEPRLTRLITTFGFVRRPPARVFLVSVPDATSDVGAAALSPHHWLVTAGDSDIDRPW